MSESIIDKKNNFKIQIRKKRVQDKISQLRQGLRLSITQQTQKPSQQQIMGTISSSLKSKQSLICSIPLLKSISFHINPSISSHFTVLAQNLFYLLNNIDNLKQTANFQNKDDLYNQIIIILINITSQDNIQAAAGESYALINNLLNRKREINTLWLFSNILYHKTQNQDIIKHFTQKLVKSKTLVYCMNRLQIKFDQQKDILIFTCYVCSFLTNSYYLTFAEHKVVLQIIQKLTQLNMESIDWFILDSMIDHAPYLKEKNYQLLHCPMFKRFIQIYVKKKKTKIVLKYLTFIKTYISAQIQQSLLKKQLQKESQIQWNSTKVEKFDSKLLKSNYQRISMLILTSLSICLQNRSPSIKCLLTQICHTIIQSYFQYVNLQSQDIYLQLISQFNSSFESTLIKYSIDGLVWQIRYIGVMIQKIRQVGMDSHGVIQFIKKSNVLQGMLRIIQDMYGEQLLFTQTIRLIEILILDQQLVNNIKYQDLNGNNIWKLIAETLQKLLNNNLIHDQKLFQQVQNILQFCEQV